MLFGVVVVRILRQHLMPVTASDQGIYKIFDLLFVIWFYFSFSLLYQWKKEKSIVNRRAFGLLAKMKDDGQKLFMIGGINLQTNEHIAEVETYDSSSKVWKFYKNLPSDLLNHYGPESGCIDSFEDSILIVGSSIFSLHWTTWHHEVLSSVPKTSIGYKCAGNIKWLTSTTKF